MPFKPDEPAPGPESRRPPGNRPCRDDPSCPRDAFCRNRRNHWARAVHPADLITKSEARRPHRAAENGLVGGACGQVAWRGSRIRLGGIEPGLPTAVTPPSRNGPEGPPKMPRRVEAMGLPRMGSPRGATSRRMALSSALAVGGILPSVGCQVEYAGMTLPSGKYMHDGRSILPRWAGVPLGQYPGSDPAVPHEGDGHRAARLRRASRSASPSAARGHGGRPDAERPAAGRECRAVRCRAQSRPIAQPPVPGVGPGRGPPLAAASPPGIGPGAGEAWAPRVPPPPPPGGGAEDADGEPPK